MAKVLDDNLPFHLATKGENKDSLLKAINIGMRYYRKNWTRVLFTEENAINVHTTRWGLRQKKISAKNGLLEAKLKLSSLLADFSTFIVSILRKHLRQLAIIQT